MKAAILLSVREKATRLPGKVLKSLGGVNVTQFLIRRLRTSAKAKLVAVATSTDPRDAVLAELAEREGVAAFRGSPDDKLYRYRDAARAFGADFVVVVDGDDPFVSVSHIDRLIAHAEAAAVDFVTFGNLPLGATGFGVRATALESICSGRRESNTEVWGHLFLDNPAYTTATLTEADPALARPDVRMTLDYADDYRFFTAVVDGLGLEPADITLEKIMAYIAAHSEVVEINRHAQAAYEAHLKKSML